MNWLARLFRGRALDRDLDRELAFHIEAQTADFIRDGLPPDEARRRARVALGGVDQVRETTRDSRGTRWIEDWWTDTRYALRTMRRSPGFTAAAVLTLGVGIGANTAVWSVVDALMRRPLPVRAPSELYALRRDGNEEDTYIVSHAMMRRIQRDVGAVARVAGMASTARMYASVGDQPEAAIVQLVSGNWFSVLGVGSAAGRTLTVGDDSTMGAQPVAVLSEGYWQRRFGGDRSLVGKIITLNGRPLTVVGVARAGFSGLTVGSTVDVWAPLAMQHELRYLSNMSASSSDPDQPWIPQEGISWLTLVARVSPQEAAAAATGVDRSWRLGLEQRMATADSVDRAYAMREHMVLEPISRGFSPLRRQFGDPLRALMASVAFVLLISCANLAGLMLARSAARTQEMALRISLGARPLRLIRQVLTESLTIAAFGGILGLAIAYWGAHALLKLASTGTRAIPLSIGLDAPMLLFAAAVSAVTGLLFGLAPALRVGRADLYDHFRTGGRVKAGSPHRVPLGKTLVASQIALSLLLVTAAVLFVRTYQNLVRIDVGYERESVIAARLDVRAARYGPEDLPSLHARLLEAARALPGVRSASLSMHGLSSGSQRISSFTVPGRTLRPGQRVAQENYVTPGFFGTVGMRLLAGRDFTEADTKDVPRVAIVSEAAAKRLFGRPDVIGERFGEEAPPDLEIVGIVADARVNSLKEAPEPLVFYPLAQGPREYITSVEVRVAGPSAQAVASLRRAIASVDRNLPVREVTTVEELLNRGLSSERLVARLASAFGMLALLLAGIGLYGVIGYSVTRRTNEMGVRLALGASPADVRWVVLRDSLGTIVLGLVAGVVLWFPLLGLTRRLVYGLSPHDPVTLALAAVLLFAVGLLAGWLPAWRASRIDPVQAIRAE